MGGLDLEIYLDRLSMVTTKKGRQLFDQKVHPRQNSGYAYVTVIGQSQSQSHPYCQQTQKTKLKKWELSRFVKRPWSVTACNISPSAVSSTQTARRTWKRAPRTWCVAAAKRSPTTTNRTLWCGRSYSRRDLRVPDDLYLWPFNIYSVSSATMTRSNFAPNFSEIKQPAAKS